MSFRQVDQRHVQGEISLMQWSPTMDLIAVASIGEVSLHRMSWQKVWSLPSSVAVKKEPAKVACIAWRPDGRVLAVGYTLGKIVLIDIENAEVLHVHDVGTVISSLYWTEHKLSKTAESSYTPFYQDRSSTYLPKSYSSAKNFGSSSKQSEEPVDDCKKVKGQSNLNLLITGTTIGVVHIYAFGIFPCGWFSANDAEKGGLANIVSAAISDDLSILTTVMESSVEVAEKVCTYRSFDVPLLENKAEEVRVIAMKYGQISSLMSYLESTIHAISEAWEDILLEIDTKLLKYAEKRRKVSEGSVSDDFLELLMFGTPSDSLGNFLLHDLTENGLKKFGHSIELAYSNIQKLVLKKLQNIAMSLFYHLIDVKGMLLWEDRFGRLNLSCEALLRAMSAVGSFLMKAIEIQQVIDSGMRNFKAFFRWLYAVILRLSDEPIPPEITKVTQQDLNFVAEFLKENFTDEWDSNARIPWNAGVSKYPVEERTGSPRAPFKLERVGQYLKDEYLAFPPSVSSNPWISFIKKFCSGNEMGDILDSDLMFPYYPEKSLTQQYTEVYKSIEVAFNGMWNEFRNSVTKRNSYDLWTHSESLQYKISHTTLSKSNNFLTMFLKESSEVNYLYILQESMQDPDAFQGLSAKFGELPRVSSRKTTSKSSHCSSHSVVDAKFYNMDTITVLLMECESPKIGSPVLVQMQLKALCQEMKPVEQKGDEADVCANLPLVRGEKFIEKSGHKRLENMRAISLAVSGPRKVASVLFSSRRQVRVYEMEVDDEENGGDGNSDSDLDVSSQSTVNDETLDSSMKDNSSSDEPFIVFDSSERNSS